jgi:hydrogenase maturation factor
MGEAAREVSGVVVGGHTEVTPYLQRPIISVTAIGYSTGRFISTSGAEPGDYIVVVGRVGGEGASLIAWDFSEELARRGVSESLIKKARSFIRDISIVKTALSIAPFVNSMHDATEGGLVQALRELSVASHVNVTVDLGMVGVDETVATIAEAMGLNPFKLLSSGCFLATVPPGKIRDVEEILAGRGVMYSIAGRVDAYSENPVLELRFRGSPVERLDKDVIDEIYKLFG